MTAIHTRRRTARALVLTLTLALAIDAAPASARPVGACAEACQSAPSAAGSSRGSDLESAYLTIGGAAIALPLIGLIIARIAGRTAGGACAKSRRDRRSHPKERTAKEQTC